MQANWLSITRKTTIIANCLNIFLICNSSDELESSDELQTFFLTFLTPSAIEGAK